MRGRRAARRRTRWPCLMPGGRAAGVAVRDRALLVADDTHGTHRLLPHAAPVHRLARHRRVRAHAAGARRARGARRTHETELLVLYTDVVAKLRPDIDPAGLMVWFKDALWYGLTIAAALMFFGDMDEPRTRRLAKTMAVRALAALEDHGQLQEGRP